jgi:hypothetical protein
MSGAELVKILRDKTTTSEQKVQLVVKLLEANRQYISILNVIGVSEGGTLIMKLAEERLSS